LGQYTSIYCNTQLWDLIIPHHTVPHYTSILQYIAFFIGKRWDNYDHQIWGYSLAHVQVHLGRNNWFCVSYLLGSWLVTSWEFTMKNSQNVQETTRKNTIGNKETGNDEGKHLNHEMLR